MTKRRLIAKLAFFTGALVICGFTGCAYLRDVVGLGFEKPKAQLQAIEITDASLESINLLVTVVIQNPNGYELGLNRMDYKLTALGLEIARGTFSEAFVVPSKGKAEVKLPFKLDANATMQIMRKYFAAPQDLTAVLDATVDFKTPLGSYATTFQQTKKIEKK